MLNETVKSKMKIALKKTLSIQTIIFILAVTGSLFYYGKSYYQNKQLVFGISDIKIILGLTIMILWIMIFSIYLMLEIDKKNKIIINQNNTLQKLLGKLITSNNNIEDNTENIMEQNEDNFDQLIKAHKNTKDIIIDINKEHRGDNIA